ncbi:DUF2793 domain-containing protein [Sulfitobacter mediterraneus]|uniref:DUF2793 domain-containing protein n=1 Tax=Sulfitobacter mediterraneus TaxID=83219 RepID=UPI001933CD0C|nr:DUF2793 domain-containing protein [Sulfitobacter mediterraneus]MBM1308676.1 DUF2793 domain-containing protein [Sulfitobacter mediterraneus]MBM1312561.1 DUF2793 domain-containing protein [Sulfitobacter mediterraneus]MBM1320942.1 DUF2793 domain-containing protein [Sulfitobacter mediterraneus]MBM1324830.1 DUF2793 domain-containing protein [Sulfitobacter mediterraneus]MBM1396176.1 DUF2793 domain-containing protein [Sulfitobacter mediterraneus]
MSEQSPILSLPYIQPAQAQKHVTHNEALRILDAVKQLAVLDAGLTAPPAGPAQGDRYIVGASATGAWAGQDHAIAVWADAAWVFFAPRTGWRADLATTGTQLRFDGALWVDAIPALDFQNLPMVGIGTTANATNRLSVAADATLLTHDGGGHQLKLNKDTAVDTASLLFQTGFSGRAEMGTAGNDDFAIKVSPDGSTFHTGLSIENSTGAVQFNSGQQFFEDVFILNDTAWSFEIPWSNPSRIMMWLSINIAARFYLFAITGTLVNATNFGEMFANPAGSLNYMTGPLTGTTGPDGEINLSIDTTGATPKMFIENRVGSNRLFTLGTMGK